MEPIRFVMDGDIIEAHNCDPLRSVLDWLRYEERRTGTKEGCAEGDCGACTVVVGQLVENKIIYRAVNACILFMPALDGKELVTVESLGKPGALHPVQQAMCDTHGSQCGFCTPGFVMSLLTIFLNSDNELPDNIEDVLAGNLCRCTGYGPIRDAALLLKNSDRPRVEFGENDTIEKLQSIRRSEMLEIVWQDPVLNRPRRYYAPKTREKLANILADHPEATILAGGTDIGVWVSKHQRSLETIISVNEVEDLKYYTISDDELEIGAAVRYSDAWRVLGDHYPDFGEVIRRIGSVQIRNAGTIGGNIANGSPIGDTLPILIALGAQLVLGNLHGRRVMPLEEFFIGYGKQDLRIGEFVQSIKIPLHSDRAIFRSYKISKRFDQDISAICAAFLFMMDGDTIESARVAFGGMAAIPKRARACEHLLAGAQWAEATFIKATDALESDFTPISDMRASDRYRMLTARNLLLKAGFERNEQNVGMRLLSGASIYA